MVDFHHGARFQGETWWGVKDSNLRRHSPTDLQSVPIGRSGISPMVGEGLYHVLAAIPSVISRLF